MTFYTVGICVMFKFFQGSGDNCDINSFTTSGLLPHGIESRSRIWPGQYVSIRDAHPTLIGTLTAAFMTHDIPLKL